MSKGKEIELHGQLKWVERIAGLMDDKFKVPGTNFRFGLDPLLNLIPYAGDVSGFVVSAALLYLMAKHGVSRKVLIIMSLNIAADFLIGAIPLIGQVSDFYIKANTRNIKLLKEHYVEGKHNGDGKGMINIILLTLFAVFAAVIYVSYLMFHWLFTHL